MASTRYTGEDATLRGWLLSDPRFTASTLNEATAFGVPSEGGPRAGGVGEANRADVAAVIQATGEQDAELRVEVLRAGMPRLTGGMRVGYRFATENADRLRGWEPPHTVTGCVPIDASTAARRNLSIVTLRTGDLVCAYAQTTSSLQIRTFDVSSQTWSAALAAPYIPGGSPSLVAAPLTLGIDGRGYVYLLVKQAQGWSLWRSTNPDTLADGWIEQARPSFGIWEPTTASEKMRLFVLPSGDMAIFEFYAAAVGGYVRQYASSDGGATFVRVAQSANLTTAQSDAAHDGQGLLGLARVDATGAMLWTSTANPWASIVDTAGATTIATSAAEAWIGFDPVGRWYTWHRSTLYVGAVMMSHSDDAGATWDQWDFAINDYNGDAAQGLNFGQVCHSGGSMYMLHQTYDGTGTNDPSPILTRLGGWGGMTWIGGAIALDANYETATLSMGQNLGGGLTGATWLPISEPDDLACWTAGGTGTDANDAITPTGRIQFTGTTSRHMSATTAPVPPQDKAMVDCEFAVTAGGSTAAPIAGFAVILTMGVMGAQLTVSASTTAFVVRSDAGTLATVTIDMTTPVQFRAILYYNGANSVGEVLYRRPGETYWTSAYSSSTWPTYAVATGLVRWGLLGASGVSSSILFSYFGCKYTAASAAWPYLYGSRGSVVADYILGRQLTGAPAAIFDRATAGLRQTYLAGLDGPATSSDVFEIPPAYDYPAANALPDVQPSPRRPWRSATDGTTETFAWITAKTSISRHYGFAVFAANWRTARLEAYTASTTTWSTIGTMDLASGRTALAWTRSGNVLRPNANDTTRYIWRGELVGATVDLGAGKLRRIASHTEGLWTTAAGKHAELVLESIDGTEGATGTMDVWARSGVLVCLDQASTYDGWRIVIEPQDTVDGYYEVGTFMPPGPLIAAGQSHGWGGSVTHEPSVAATRSADFVSRARRLGPSARTWSWSWPDGIDQSRLMDSPPRPDFLATSAGTEGIANLNDAPYLVAGLLEDVESGARPIVALEYMPSTNGATLTDPRLFLLCRIASSIGLEHIQGDPERDAVWRISPITMQEIV
jgi:hypothetical protein